MAKKLRICHISTMTRWGGVERSLVDFLTHQSDADSFYHSLLAISSVPEVIQPLQQKGVPIFRPQRRFHYDPGAIIQMARWLRQQRIQIVHTYNAQGNAWGSIASLLANIPVLIGGERGTVWSAGFPLSWLNKWAYQRAKYVVVNSNATKNMVWKRYGIAEQKIRVVYNVVPSFPKVDRALIRSELGLATSDIVIGSVGRVVAEKHFKTFVDTAREIIDRREGIRFVLVGGGGQLEALRNYVSSAGLWSHIILTGVRKDARRLLQAFDVFVSTSVRESFGNALIEAALAGIPCVAPRVDGIPEAVVEDVTGILLTPTEPVEQILPGVSSALPEQVFIDGKLSRPLALSPDQLADAILYLVDNPGLRRQYGEAGRTRAIKMFSPERYKLELEQLYSKAFTASERM